MQGRRFNADDIGRLDGSKGFISSSFLFPLETSRQELVRKPIVPRPKVMRK